MANNMCETCDYRRNNNGCYILKDVSMDKDRVCLLHSAYSESKVRYFEKEYNDMVGAMKQLATEKDYLTNDIGKGIKYNKFLYKELKPVFAAAGLDFNKAAVIHGKSQVIYGFNCSVACKLTVKIAPSRKSNAFLDFVKKLEQAGYVVFFITWDEIKDPTMFAKKKEEILSLAKRLNIKEAHKDDCETCLFLENKGASCSMGRALDSGWCKCYFHYCRTLKVAKELCAVDSESDVFAVPEKPKKKHEEKPEKKDMGGFTCASCGYRQSNGLCWRSFLLVKQARPACDFYWAKD